MFETILNLITIQVIAVIIIDLSDFTDHWKLWLSRILTKGKIESFTYSLKPFDCSFCMTWWIGLGYIILNHQFSVLYCGFILLLSFLTPVINNLLIQFRDLLIRWINKI